MATYTKLILRDLRTAGWSASCHRVHGDRYVATAWKAGHVCAAEDDGELGALTKLQQSVREVEAAHLFTPGQVVRLRDHVGDIPPGHYVICAVDEDGMTLSELGEDPETGDLCRTDKECRLPMGEAGKVGWTGVFVGTSKQG